MSSAASQDSSSSPSFLVATLSLLVLASIFFFYSFVASLEKFLTSRRPVSAGSSSVAADAGGAAVKALDDKIWGKETGRLYGDPADPWSGLSVVRVYVYEMPAKFTYDLLEINFSLSAFLEINFFKHSRFSFPLYFLLSLPLLPRSLIRVAAPPSPSGPPRLHLKVDFLVSYRSLPLPLPRSLMNSFSWIWI